MTHNKLIIQPERAFCNQRLRKLPSTEFHLNQITFGILIRLIRSGGPSCPRGPFCSTFPYYIYVIYNKVADRVLKPTKTFI